MNREIPQAIEDGAMNALSFMPRLSRRLLHKAFVMRASGELAVLRSMAILLVIYRYLVRFTWIGAILNGGRHTRPQPSPPASAAPAQG